MARNGFFDTNDQFGSRHLLRRMPDYVDARVLGTDTNESITPPSDAKYVIFSSEAAFWVRKDAAATVPSGDVTDGTASELNPAGYDIEGVTTIQIISETAQNVSLAYYNTSP
jgi:hypothetical protein